MKIRLAIAVLVMSAVTRCASAGVVIAFENKTSASDAKPTAGSVWVGTDRVRMETGGNTIIFRGDKQALWIVQDGEKSYMEMNKDSMKQVSDAMAKMQEQLKNMPAEQRAMVEQLMKGKMGGPADAAKPEPITYKKIGKTETINDFPCTSYEAMQGNKPMSEMWVTEFKRLDLKPADFQVFAQMAEFMSSMMGPFGKQMQNGFVQRYAEGDQPDALPGVPIRTIMSGGSIQELKRVSREDIAAAKFEVPDGYKKKDMMGGRQRGGE